MCGRDGENDCGNGSDLKGFHYDSMFDDDNCGQSKAVCANNVYEYVTAHFDDPYTEFIIIGHSAGADAAILATDKLLKNGYKENIKGLVILDPTLTSGKNDALGYSSDYSNLTDPTYGTSDDQGPLLTGIVFQNVPVFVGLGMQSPDAMKAYLDPLTTNKAEFINASQNSTYDYRGDYIIDHPGMATSGEVINDVLRFLK
jgi:pimeloyl-ACP methyl ester carboxylesterase